MVPDRVQAIRSEVAMEFTTAHAPGSPSFADALAAYLRAGRVRALSPYTLVGYEQVVGTLVRFAATRGVTTLAGFELDLVEAWIESRSPLAPASVRRYVRTLRAFARWCATRYGGPDPLAGLRAPRVPRKIRPLFTDDDLTRLVAAAAPNLAYAIVLLLETGLRASEAVGLELDDLDDEGITVRHAKEGRERWVPLSPALRRATRRYIVGVRPALARPGVSSLLVGVRGDPMRRETLRHGLARAGVRAGVAGVRVSPHTFRHQFAHDYAMSGGSVFALRDTLGHTSLEMVAVYTHPSRADLAVGVARHSPLAARGTARGSRRPEGQAPAAAPALTRPAARGTARPGSVGRGRR